MDERGDKLAVLRNSQGFLLTLMYDKRMTPEQGYPGLFHIGFLPPMQHDVDGVHEALRTLEHMAPNPAKLQRGYYNAPGGVLVEVSTMHITEPA